jgi:hypothetical protein
MALLPRVVGVESIGDHVLRLTFSDGVVRELDFTGVLAGGLFEPLEQADDFARVEVDEVAGTIRWPNGVDLDPDVLHGDHDAASGRQPHLLRQYRTSPSV